MTKTNSPKLHLSNMNTAAKNARSLPVSGGRVLAANRYASDDDIRSGLNNNDLIIGCSGSGKTGGYVIPNIRRHHGSMIITDTKKQLYRMLKRDLTSAGYKVYLLDFTDPEQSMGYNPLDYIRRKKRNASADQEEQTEVCNSKDILSIANILSPTKMKDDPFWETSARTVISFLIAFTLEALFPEEQDMLSVVDLYRQLSVPSGKNVLEQWCDDNPDSFAAKKYGMFRGIYDADRTWACIQQFVAAALDIFDFAEIQPLFRCSDKERCLDLHKIGQEKTAVFLNVSDTDRYADKLVNLFYLQALQVLCQDADRMRPMGRLQIPVRFILDDFAANACIEDFDKIISVIRSRNISVSVILQNMTQLYSLYSEDKAATILNNCDHVLYLGGQDITTAEYIGTRCGKTAETVLLMPADKAYLIEKGKKGELVDKKIPYEDDQRESDRR